MTRIWNDPGDFADEMIDGFVAANRRYVRRVHGGVVRSTVSPKSQVAVVVGGGSGHYPAFGGLVGPGLAHGAAMGNLFASPSAQQIVSVAKSADNGGGVLLTYGNYAGDALNFDAAQESLRELGIPTQTVTVTDDVASATAGERSKRRGIAGDLTVFRVAAAAAEVGHCLEDVVGVARKANERTFSFGVAFSGCTLPGAAAPLFTVAEDRMALGLGIHGEPGIGETGIPSANELAALLVNRLLSERPDDADRRVIPILNGLGSLKYEEMFVVYRRIAELLEGAGFEITDPHVGEYCTSLDMAGTSLTLFWPDDELAQLWEFPVDSPAYRRGAVRPTTQLNDVDAEEIMEDVIPPADAESISAVQTVLRSLEAISTTIDANVDELGRLDAIAGDGDHGIGMQRGSRAALTAGAAAANRGAGAGTVLLRAADAWSDRAGGASGVLWGLILSSLGAAVGDAGYPRAATVAEGVAAGAAAVMTYGKADVGDKTLVDAFVPFSAELGRGVDAGALLTDAWRQAAQAATRAAKATADLLPRMGRARAHGQNSVGTPDPGAISLALIATALTGVLAEEEGSTDARTAPARHRLR